MGSFNDYRSPSRENWKFEYKGKDLLHYAEKKLLHFADRETFLRGVLSKRLADQSVRSNSATSDKLRSQLTTVSTEREKCLVWVHEFKNRPEESYLLGLADVTYLDIASIPNSEEIEED